MRRLVRVSAASLTATVLLVSVVTAAKPVSVPVTVTIADVQENYPLLVHSDVQGPYVATKQITSVIEQFIGGGTDWILTTYSYPKLTPTNRTVFFSLEEPAASDNPASPPMGTGYRPAHLTAKCRLSNVNMLSMPVGASARCPGSFRFQGADSLWYRFSFQPANYPHVDDLRVTCAAADARGCISWQIAPSNERRTGTDPNPKSLNRLLRIEAGSDQVVAELGDYFLSFLITVTR
jgi:hypothetical protein